MADLSQVQIDFTYKDIIRWDRDTTRKNYKDPEMRPLIDEVIRRHQASQTPQVEVPVSTEKTEAQAAAIKKEAEATEALANEVIRFRNLSPAQQEQEMIERAAQKKLAEQQAEKEAIRSRVASEKEQNYLNAIGENFASAKDRNEEIARRYKEREDKIAAAEVEAETAAAAAEAERVATEAKAKEDAEAAVAAETAKAAVEKEIADKAETDRLAAEAKAKADAEAASRPKQKLVLDFQAEDENGNPIGRRTHLEADTQEELVEKMKTAYVNAVRYAERMKKRASQPAAPEGSGVFKPSVTPLTEEQVAALQKDLESKDETKQTLAQIKLEKNKLDQAKVQSEIDTENKRRDVEAGKFLKIHKDDFFACQANANMLHDYIREKNLPYNIDSLEEAFEVVQHKLASDTSEPIVPATQTDDELKKQAEAAVEAARVADAKVQAETAAKAAVEAQEKLEAEIRAKVLAEIEAKKKLEQEQAAANTAATQASVAPAAPAAGSTPTEKSAAAANTAVTAPKPPAGGIEPGSLHGGRPQSSTSSAKVPVYTKQDISRMPRDEFRKKMRDPKFVRIVNDLFAPAK